MGQLPDLQEARRRLGLALEALPHDRWVLGYLRGGLLQPIAASEIVPRFLQSRSLSPLSRRALFEKRPVVVNSVIENPNPSNGYDWELDGRLSSTRRCARSVSGPLVCSRSAAVATTGTRTQTSITQEASPPRSRRWSTRFGGR